ncbi:MAG: rhomboid family intramembrane serine protease [Candidatus Bathyarchaeota archaeon]|nr:MAG: rhomboid family intramembrane serine protease [Candidatus Bathyarchaeota archaeon]
MKKNYLLIFLCVFATVSVWAIDTPESVERHLMFSGDNFFQGRIWTPATALFIHGDLAHLFGNMLFLYVFGNTLEDVIGAKKTIAMFFLGGGLSFLLSLFLYDWNVPMIGASAAIFTLTAVVMLAKPLRFSLLFMLPVGLVAMVYFTYNVMAVFYGVGGNIAYASHVIGFSIGIPFGIAWSPKWARNLLITIGLLAVYIIVTLALETLLFSGPF